MKIIYLFLLLKKKEKRIHDKKLTMHFNFNFIDHDFY